MRPVTGYYLRQACFAIGHSVSLLLSLSPFDLWPFGFFAPVLLLIAADEQRDKRPGQIALAALLFAAATTAITFGWIFATIWCYSGQNVFLSISLSAIYAILFQLKFPLVFFLLKVSRLTLRRGAFEVLAIAAVLALGDALAPELFPWSWGNGIAAEPHLRQLAAIGSVYLMSFFAALIAATGTAMWLNRHGSLAREFKAQKLPFAVLTLLLLSGILFRYWPSPNGERPSLRMAIAQTNIGAAASAKSSDADFAREAVTRLFQQSAEAVQLYAPLDVVLWPEATMPFHSASPDAANREIYSVTFDGVLEYLLRRASVAVIFQDMYRDKSALTSRLSLRDARASSAQNYFKRRLVPWGEYLPFGSRRWFPEAGQYSAPAGRANELEMKLGQHNTPPTYQQMVLEVGLLQQPALLRQKFSLPAEQSTVRIKPLLCYEALYPADAETQTADIIVNLASDAWFGDGIEGAQHASAAMLRAVENGRPMLRAAMSGISFAVDFKGDDLAPRTGQGRSELLFAEVPLETRKTPFSRLGMFIFYALMVLALWPWLVQKIIFSRIRENR